MDVYPEVISGFNLILILTKAFLLIFSDVLKMKKNNNNKFRNSNNNMYNLNYRFDSVSPAGKFSGTALDLIRRYNELAKEAQTAGNYVEMEVFRQYAEHYRKIVTEANERRAYYQQQNQTQTESETEVTSAENTSEQVNEEQNEKSPQEVIEQKPLSLKKKTLKIVEVKENDGVIDSAEPEKKKRVSRRKPKADSAEAAAV